MIISAISNSVLFSSASSSEGNRASAARLITSAGIFSSSATVSGCFFLLSA